MATQKRICHYFALAVYQPLCPARYGHFPTESSGQLNEASAMVTDEETGLERWWTCPRPLGGAVRTHSQAQRKPSSVIIHLFMQSLIYPTNMHSRHPALSPGDSMLDKMVATLHLWNLYYILPGAYYACKITIAFDLPSTLKFTKCIHTHYLILNKFTSIPDASINGKWDLWLWSGLLLKVHPLALNLPQTRVLCITPRSNHICIKLPPLSHSLHSAFCCSQNAPWISRLAAFGFALLWHLGEHSSPGVWGGVSPCWPTGFGVTAGKWVINPPHGSLLVPYHTVSIFIMGAGNTLTNRHTSTMCLQPYRP